MPNVRSNWPGCFCWNSFYRFYRFQEMPTTLKITGEYSYVATNVLTNASWPANLCEYIALAATNVFEILTLLVLLVRTQFTNPSWPRPQDPMECRSHATHQGPYAPQGSKLTTLLPKLSVTSKVSARTLYAWVGSRVRFRSREDVILLEFTSPVDREYMRRCQ